MKKIVYYSAWLIWLILIMLSTSCVSTKSANTEYKAKRKLQKYHAGIENQIKAYPSLVKNAFTKIELIETIIPEDSTKLKIALQNIDSLTKISKDYSIRYNTLDSTINAISDINSDTVNLNNYKFEIKILLDKVKRLNAENKLLFEKYQSNATLNHTGIYEDSTFVINYIFKDGLFTIDVKTKAKQISTEVPVTQYDIDAVTHFWQDFKFWIFFILFILLLAIVDTIKKLFI